MPAVSSPPLQVAETPFQSVFSSTKIFEMSRTQTNVFFQTIQTFGRFCTEIDEPDFCGPSVLNSEFIAILRFMKKKYSVPRPSLRDSDFEKVPPFRVVP